ncbi:restriction endonuclease subunit S [Tenacibaculum finnmarkense genomovar finnmarkense]|uniref:restriction endonuclease subunit S n=1 Tax=Tenacibaculum finnmarkense TaxID=2781243 RepID=UPI001E2F1BF2|nr:restriction endonuclease subunit S [Tenacibaculum finnmarkense]MCD8417835.1 restriction endonuclease subunit S [Tenacibaculum finnmarkense genomovar finnmarkense]MCG8202988.1 restriction endonuclease subunit S [Tenacibaculum finnmarkense genomovar finnmarkense]MCG8212888.1 restriction endonuclease subunit S [Tenacibaculum finnmarkense genomovar finnmarkense]MCG8220421.1 restriction endonuclease subunit S [Tenacibaculum finnmarkense genomovar finnmarkense]MCG8223135.1 restriction endonucleas
MESKLPKNWVETDLDTVILRMTNGSSLKQHEVEFENSFPISRIETIWNETIDLERVKYVEANENDIVKYSLQKGDVLFSHINSDKHLGKTAVFNLDKTIIHGINLLLLRAMPQFNGDLLNYILRHYRFSGKFIEVAQRSVNQSSINQKKLKSFIVPLPPLAEQQRIVAKLDTLFGSLDALKIRLNNIPQLIKNFKQAVLTQAVTGKLTQEWRVGKELEEWEETELINLILQKPRNGYSPPGVNYITEVKSLSLSATTSGKFNASKVKYLDIEKPKNDSHLWLKKGDILIQRSNSLDYVGTSAIYDGEDDDFIYPDIMMKIQVNEKIDNSYMNYVLSSSKIRTYYKDNATGTAGNMPKINQVVVSNTPICYPPKEEQTEIVKRVENLFSKADAIENQYKTLKEKIDRLPQAILAKAFKGELVAQLPTDGDAKDLLEEIKKLKESLVVKPKKKVVRNKK